jgi:hypothetical protein
MKRLLIVLAALVLIIGLASSESHARGIGVKGGWGFMMNDYSDEKINDTWCAGLFFDTGKFLFDSLIFRPGVDYMKLKTDDVTLGDVWGIHMDWYWFFMSGAKFKPFLGFGPALNYYNSQKRDWNKDDSDAGIEGFGGVEFEVDKISIMLEGRYVVHDIADTGAAVFKVYLGFLFNF